MLHESPSKALTIIFLAILVIDVALILLLMAAGVPRIVIPLVIVITMVDFLILAFVVKRPRRVSANDVLRLIMRLETDDPDALLDEAKARYASHVSAKDALSIAASYCYKGDGANAEIHARQALDLLEETGVHTHTDRESRVIYELAQIALYDAQVAQGQFAEAANGLRPYIDVSPAPNMVMALVIWALYLAGQDDNARVMLTHLRTAQRKETPKPYAPLPGAILRIPPKYALIVAYMRHKLLGVVNADELLAHRDALPKWQEELARNAHNPYGARLRDIVADLVAVLV